MEAELEKRVRDLQRGWEAKVEASVEREEAAFAELVRAHHPTMVRLAHSFVSSSSVANEVVQETWLVADGPAVLATVMAGSSKATSGM